MNELKNSVSSLNKDVKEGKSSLEVFRKKVRRIIANWNCNFWIMKYTIAGKICAFMEPVRKARMRTLRRLCTICKIAFHRVHWVGKEKRNPREPRAIIACFLRYPEREAVFSRRSSIEDESGFWIGPYLPKQVVEMSKKLVPKMLEARKEGQRAAFSRSEPYKVPTDRWTLVHIILFGCLLFFVYYTCIFLNSVYFYHCAFIVNQLFQNLIINFKFIALFFFKGS